jgi:hypothetical protein
MPKKNEKIAQPDREVFLKSLDDTDNQMDELHEKFKKYKDEIIKQTQRDNKKGKDDSQPMREILGNK